jgi:hypothetical protein
MSSQGYSKLMIYIDFAPGAFGHFVEYACNTLVAGVSAEKLPFTSAGNSHNVAIAYTESRKFRCDHYTVPNPPGDDTEPAGPLPNDALVVQIKHTADDLLVLMMGMYERSQFELNLDQLHIDTYNKLTQEPIVGSRLLLLNHINEHYCQVKESYDAVKDSSWPDINTVADFKNLPQHIQDECINRHKLYFVEISADNPNCPRNILRDYYTNRFKNPDEYLNLDKMFQYHKNTSVYTIPFMDILDKEMFKQHLLNISKWKGFTVPFDYNKYDSLYNEFISRQPYRNAKKKCVKIIQKIQDREVFDFEPLHILEESYIIAQLNIPFPFDQQEWFKNSQEIYDLL